MTTRVGVTHAAHYMPPTVMTAEELASRTGLSVETIHEDYGLREKRIGAPGESAIEHALKAGKALLEGRDPAEIDLLIYATGSMPDYLLHWDTYRLHEELGLKHARFLELRQGCIGSLHALEAAKNYLAANSRLNRAMVIGAEGYHFSEAFADYSNPNNEPMYIFADGAAAVLLESDRVADLPNALGEFAYLVDSTHHAEFPIPAGGVKHFPSEATVRDNLHAVQMTAKDPRDLKRFGIRYIQNYLAVIRQALEASGHEGKPDFVVSNQLKLPLMRILTTKLGLTFDDTIYTMPEFGHVGTADILLGLGEMLRNRPVAAGKTAAIVSSGVSFSWGAAGLEILA